MPDSPFKFLSAYEKKDKDIFFGREKEIEILYEMTYDTNFMLVVGGSGSGKSSLIQCGLANRFKATRWSDIYIKRDKDINESLKIALDKELETSGGINFGESPTISDKLKNINRATFTPIYLIFDQFEEIFTIKSNEKEQTQFFKTVQSIITSASSCKVIIIMRDEFTPQLWKYESIVPTLFDHKFRVEKMRPDIMKQEVVAGTLDKMQSLNKLVVEDSKEIGEKVVENLMSSAAGLELTYLQVYLDRLYRKAKPNKDGIPVITSSLVDEQGGFDDILKDFLDKQLKKLGEELKLMEDEPIRILGEMVTEEKTKKALERSEQYEVAKKLKMPAEKLDECIQAYVNMRVIRQYDDGKVELAHDVLGPIIWALLSAQDQLLRGIKDSFTRRYNDFKKNSGSLLPAKEVDSWKEYLPLLDLTSDQKQFFEDSERDVDRKARASRRRKIVLGGITGIAIIASIAAGLGWYLSNKNFNDLNTTKEQLETTKEQLDKREVEIAQSEIIQKLLTQEKGEALAAARKDSTRAAQSFRKNQLALQRTEKAEMLQELAENERIKAYEDFLDEVEKGKELEQMISGNDPYAVEFLTEEGDRQLANYNYQNALTYYATAKFILEPDTINKQLIYQKLLERIQLSSLMAEMENLFQSGFFTLCQDKLDELYKIALSEQMYYRINPTIVKRESQIKASENEWRKALTNATIQNGNEEEIEYMNIGSPSEPSKFVSWPDIGTERLKNLMKLSITTSMKEMYLKSIPTSVDSLVISHSGIENIPSIFKYDNLSYLKINDCFNLKTIGEEIQNYNILESLIITGNPNIERVSFDIVELDRLKHLELSDNPNLILIPYFFAESSSSDKLETLILKNMDLSDETVMSENTEDILANVWLGDELDNFFALKNLEIDNVSFDYLIGTQFNFIDSPNLKRLRLANLDRAIHIPFISMLENLKELSIENIPINYNLIDEISGLTGLTKLVLTNLRNLPTWGDLSNLTNLRYLTLKNIPNISEIGNLINSLPNLEYLELDSISIDQSFAMNLNRLKNLKVLKINNCEVNDLVLNPNSLVNLEELELLNIEGLIDKKNWLDSIPLLNNLRKLSITTHFPEFIRSMNNLSELLIEYRNNDFPQIFHSNMKLEKLSIVNSRTQKLPSSIGGLKDLKAFYLYATPVTSLVELMPLENLEYIFLRRNGTLLDIPKQLNEMKNLKRIVYFHINNGALKKRLEEILDKKKLITVNSKPEFIKKARGIINVEIER